MWGWLIALLARLLYSEPTVVQRGSGDPVKELVPTTIKAQLGLLYNTWAGWALCQTPWLRRYQLWHSEDLGRRYDAPESRAAIPAFIKDYGIPLDELEKPLEGYRTLNEFFTRRLRPGARPLYSPGDDTCLVQPADARVVAFSDVHAAQLLWVKGRGFTAQELLGLQQPLPGRQAIVVGRLAPEDYHRFNSPVAGTIASITWLGGELFSVKAAAINSRVNVLCENRRAVLRLETPAFGTAWLVAVGACQVGSVRLAVAAGDAVERGQELGWFQYGGSSVVLLLGAQRVRLDADLLENSARRLETLVRMGTSLGRAVQPL